MSAKPASSGPAWKKEGESSKGLPLVPIILGVIALIAVIAVVATSVSNEEDDATSQAASKQQTAPVTISGDPLPELAGQDAARSEEHTSELQSLMRISYAVFCLKKTRKKQRTLLHHIRDRDKQTTRHRITQL